MFCSHKKSYKINNNNVYKCDNTQNKKKTWNTRSNKNILTKSIILSLVANVNNNLNNNNNNANKNNINAINQDSNNVASNTNAVNQIMV